MFLFCLPTCPTFCLLLLLTHFSLVYLIMFLFISTLPELSCFPFAFLFSLSAWLLFCVSFSYFFLPSVLVVHLFLVCSCLLVFVSCFIIRCICLNKLRIIYIMNSYTWLSCYCVMRNVLFTYISQGAQTSRNLV